MTRTENHVTLLASRAKAASHKLAVLSTEVRDQALLAIAEQLEQDAEEILRANAEDCAEANEMVAAGILSRALYDRLKLDRVKLQQMAQSVRAVAELPDPVGVVQFKTLLDDGLELHRVTCPLGVLAVIFESRPDAVTQITALALKSANAVILKGGKEARRSIESIVASIHAAIAGLPENSVTALTERSEIDALLELDRYIDLVIPRGSNELVRYIQTHTRIPVLGHAEGICHVYVDKDADLKMALDIAHDAKVQYPAACNSAETLLVHASVAETFLPRLFSTLSIAGVELRGCPHTTSIEPQIPQATEQDWSTEYSGPILSVKVVRSLDEAIEHINTYSSSHTDAIVTENMEAAEKFMNFVDSAGVFHNASTRFADGYRYGFGAEVGISTCKMHARGPVGLEGLVSYKYKLYGSGQTVAQYSGPQARQFKHQRL